MRTNYYHGATMSSPVWCVFILLICATLLAGNINNVNPKAKSKVSTSKKVKEESKKEPDYDDMTIEVEVSIGGSNDGWSPKEQQPAKQPTVFKRFTPMDPNFLDHVLKRSTRDLSFSGLRTAAPYSCATYECENGGTCVPRRTSNNQNIIQCLCPFGYGGPKCEERLSIKYPKFDEPGSYIILKQNPPLRDTYTIEIEIRLQSQVGLIFYSNPSPTTSPSDFFSLTLTDNRQLEFRFGTDNDKLTIMKSYERLELMRWYQIRLERKKRQGTIMLDDRVLNMQTRFTQHMGFQSRNTRLRLYIGGFPNQTNSEIRNILTQQAGAGAEVGFIGCIKSLRVNGQELDLRLQPFTGDVFEGAGIKDCTDYKKCDEHKCLGNGTCVLVSPDTPKCQCPRNRVGKYCEKGVTLKLPKFTGGSFLKYSILKQTSRSRTNLEIVFKPVRPNGLILYSGYSMDRRGDFIAIALQDGYLKGYYNLGHDTVTLRSPRRISLHRWHHVFFTLEGRLGRLEVDEQSPRSAVASNKLVQLTIRHELYLGNHDNFDYVSADMRMNRGFHGCIQKLAVNGKVLDLIKDASVSVNVENCVHPCSNRVNPCTVNGECLPFKEQYICSCAMTFMGRHCEEKMNIADMTIPEFFGYSYLKFSSSDIMKTVSKPEMSISLTVFLKKDINRGILFFLESNTVWHSHYILLKLVNNTVELSSKLQEAKSVQHFGKIGGYKPYTITIKREPMSSSTVSYKISLNGTNVAGMKLNVSSRIQFTQLLIGGVDKQTASKLKIKENTGIAGCIKKITVSTDSNWDQTLFVKDATGGANVGQCTQSSLLYL